MRIAIEGCCHGELDKIYAAIKNTERISDKKVDLVIICGDFQPIRNTADLDTIACPEKYRALGTFYQYYSGQKKAPYPTIFIGGNHESSNYLWELYHGGWAAPDIYFLGFAGTIRFGGLRIAGLSGIYKPQHYELGHHEIQPFNDNDCRSIYHVRKYNIFRLAQVCVKDEVSCWRGEAPVSNQLHARDYEQIREPLDVFLSHDWPRGIAHHGNTKRLILSKPFLANEINTNTLGSLPNEFLLKRLKPSYWFAAHMHVKFAALYKHNDDPQETASATPDVPQTMVVDEGQASTAEVENPDEIDIRSEPDEEEASKEDPSVAATTDIAADAGMCGMEAVQASSDASAPEAIATPLQLPKISEAVLSSDVLMATAPVTESTEEMSEVEASVEVPTASVSEKQSDASAPEIEAPKSPSRVPNGKSENVAESSPQQSPRKPGAPPSAVPSKNRYTRFLALDKCLPNRDFLQILDIPVPESGEEVPKDFFYDEEWLAVMRATEEYFTLGREQKAMPDDASIRRRIDQELKWVKANISSQPGGLRVPKNFRCSAPPHVHGHAIRNKSDYLRPHLNPQTEALCNIIQIPNRINAGGVRTSDTDTVSPVSSTNNVATKSSSSSAPETGSGEVPKTTSALHLSPVPKASLTEEQQQQQTSPSTIPATSDMDTIMVTSAASGSTLVGDVSKLVDETMGMAVTTEMETSAISAPASDDGLEPGFHIDVNPTPVNVADVPVVVGGGEALGNEMSLGVERVTSE
ncbi:lariat debranching enzyme [Quaeritorhiza haematococci]|nr:lariat debranching enzyme [Quaeritorhiza haematococci]